MKRRTLLSGKKKSSDIAIAPQKQNKPSSLFDHTTKIEQKLQRLRSQINEKKKQSITNLNPTSSKSLQANQQNQTTKLTKTPLVCIDATDESESISAFLKTIGLENYEKLLIDNGVDSLAILKQIKQSQLEEIGVVKGHALKILVSLKKMESKDKANLDRITSSQTSRSHKLGSKDKKASPQQKIQEKQQKKDKSEPLQIIIQTEDYNEQQKMGKRRYFCLYCYQMADGQFCRSDCEQLYNKMFEKYEKNLQKVQQLYGSKLEKTVQEDQVEQADLVDDIDFLDAQFGDEDQNDEEIDALNYEEALGIIRAAKEVNFEENMRKLASEREQWEAQNKDQ